MSFDAEKLRDTIARHGPVVRVVVAAVKGSAPREPGASMLVWADGQSGTIGGGALEFSATASARELLADGGVLLSRHPLGPVHGQCCGGAVTLVSEVWNTENLNNLQPGPVARRVDGTRAMPLSIQRALRNQRSTGLMPDIVLDKGWVVEQRASSQRDVWIYGAGHVGRALVDILAPLPGIAITWIDTSTERFPTNVPASVTQLAGAHPATFVGQAPRNAEHLVLTYSHALDLEVCHAILGHSFTSVGLIGSKTKWARFRKRLAALGHAPAHVARVTCPIGDPLLGKHPHAIAIGVATQFLQRDNRVGSEVRTA